MTVLEFDMSKFSQNLQFYDILLILQNDSSKTKYVIVRTKLDWNKNISDYSLRTTS